MTWDPDRYLQFEDHRLRPAIDLLARIPTEEPSLVVDLGCGTGNVTKLLRHRWRDAHIVGVDNSPDMLETAADVDADIEWVLADAATWAPDRSADVIYSNATLHWLGDHAGLFPRLMSLRAAGGVLALQMPDNFRAPTHTSVADVVRSGQWRHLDALVIDPPVAPIEVYHRMLAPLARSLDIWTTEYVQVLTGEDPVTEWLKGSWLRPFLTALEAEERARFLSAYSERVQEAYPRQPDGTTLLPLQAAVHGGYRLIFAGVAATTLSARHGARRHPRLPKRRQNDDLQRAHGTRSAHRGSPLCDHRAERWRSPRPG